MAAVVVFLIKKRRGKGKEKKERGAGWKEEEAKKERGESEPFILSLLVSEDSVSPNAPSSVTSAFAIRISSSETSPAVLERNRGGRAEGRRGKVRKLD